MTRADPGLIAPCLVNPHEMQAALVCAAAAAGPALEIYSWSVIRGAVHEKRPRNACIGKPAGRKVG